MFTLLGFSSCYKDRMIKDMSRFFWCGDGDPTKKKYHLVAWDKVCVPKDQGGLGILDLKFMNKVLLFLSPGAFSLNKTSLSRKLLLVLQFY